MGEMYVADVDIDNVADENMEALVKEVSDLKDLFLRRLLEDKQKSELIGILRDAASFAVIEPFLSDLILLLDRLEKNDNEFVQSVHEELYEILKRRGVQQITVDQEFDPSLHKAIRAKLSTEVVVSRIHSVLRNGYLYAGKVIRPAEVIVITPATEINMSLETMGPIKEIVAEES